MKQTLFSLCMEQMGTSLQEVKVITCTTTQGPVKKDPTHLRRKCKHKHLPQHACSHILHFWRRELQSESSWIFTHTRIDNECRRGRLFYRRVSGPCNLLPLYLHETFLIPDWSPAKGGPPRSIQNASVRFTLIPKCLKKKTKLRRSNKLLESHSHSHENTCSLLRAHTRPGSHKHSLRCAMSSAVGLASKLQGPEWVSLTRHASKYLLVSKQLYGTQQD